MKIGISSSDISKSKNDIIFFIAEEEIKNFKNSTRPVIYDLVENDLALNSFKGKLSDIQIINVDKQPFRRIIVAGLGKKEDVDSETVRRAAHNALRTASKLNLKYLSVAQPNAELLEKEIVRALSDGFRLSNYEFDKYKTEKDSKYNSVSEAKIFVSKVSPDLENTLLYSKITCEATNFVRDLQSDNGDYINPEYLAKLAQKLAKTHKLKLKLLNKKQLQKESLDLMLGVSQGSRFEPYLIILEYNGDSKSKDKTAIVGKGITYDTGGLDIKTRWMADMHMDMSGAAIVLGVVKAVAELKLKKNIIAVAPVCENAVGSLSQKPGNICNSYSGKTIEIGNTDAEGRLILADALSYVNKNYKPKKIIDFATLTGSIMIALGHSHAGVWSTDEEIMFKLKAASETSGDLIWELPLVKDYSEYLKSSKADLSNISSYTSQGMGLAGSTTAALFLKNFVDKTPWVHIDIAGVAMNNKRRYYRPKDGTGFGVRLMIDYFNQK